MLPSLVLPFQRKFLLRSAILATLFLFFRHRISVGLTLAYTYLAFTFSPAPVLGDRDGWNLTALVPPPDAPELVPRIIHQARLGDLEMKDTWVTANASCAALHPAPEWRFELWDTPRANQFVEEEYPELLETYLGYGQEIQRSNAIRYLVLYKYGGIYLDLDVACKVPLDFFTTVDWVSPPGVPTGINNAFMAVRPGHPFLKHAIDNLKGFDLDWVSLYATDMFSTGCHYISTMHATYSERSTLRTLPPSYKLGGVSKTPVFDHLGAASWHRGDAAAIKVLGNVVGWVLKPVRLVGLAVGVALVGVGVWVCVRRRRAGRRAGSGGAKWARGARVCAFRSGERIENQDGELGYGFEGCEVDSEMEELQINSGNGSGSGRRGVWMVLREWRRGRLLSGGAGAGAGPQAEDEESLLGHMSVYGSRGRSRTPRALDDLVSPGSSSSSPSTSTSPISGPGSNSHSHSHSSASSSLDDDRTLFSVGTSASSRSRSKA